LAEVIGLGEYTDHDRPLAVVHARNEAEADIAANAVRAACTIGDAPPATGPVVAMRIAG
jgi:thymidine phosphorylase